jgi:hypothetical protein
MRLEVVGAVRSAVGWLVLGASLPEGVPPEELRTRGATVAMGETPLEALANLAGTLAMVGAAEKRAEADLRRRGEIAALKAAAERN